MKESGPVDKYGGSLAHWMKKGAEMDAREKEKKKSSTFRTGNKALDKSLEKDLEHYTAEYRGEHVEVAFSAEISSPRKDERS